MKKKYQYDLYNQHKEGLRSKVILYTILIFLTIAAFLSSYVVIKLKDISQVSLITNKNMINEPFKDERVGKDEDMEIPVAEENGKDFSKKITNIAVFGLDERATEYDGEWARADSMMILTIDEKHKKIKLSSILRDCYVNIEEYGYTVKDKINHSFAYGAAEEYERSQNPIKAYHAGGVRSVNTLNNNFKLDVKDYIVINFASFQKVIEKIGGVDINLTQDEIDEINCAMGESDVYGKISPIEDGAGIKSLNGKQALAYARNRNNGGDADRSMRQRIVVKAVYKKMMTLKPLELPGVIKELIAMVKTNLNYVKIIAIATKVLKSEMQVASLKFPVDNNWYMDMINGICYDIIDDEELNINQMKDFIYNDILPEDNRINETTTAPQ